MTFVFGILALGLIIAAVKANDRATKLFLAVCCLLNVIGAIMAIAENDPYAFKLRHNDGTYEPSYRR